MAARREPPTEPKAPVTRAATPSPFDFVGDLEATIALVAVPTETARALLPDGLRLAPPAAGSAEHPLLIMLGRQRNVRLALLPTGLDYLEAVIAVPFVGHDPPRGHPRGVFGYLPRLFLDRALPTVLGRVLLAYAKRRAVMTAADQSYRIASAATGELLLSARFGAAGRPLDPPLPAPVAEVLALPVISRRGRGAWRYTIFDLRVDAADMAPLAIDLTIERPFLPGLPAGTFALAADSGRAFRLRTSWRLTGPVARRSPPGQPALDNGGRTG